MATPQPYVEALASLAAILGTVRDLLDAQERSGRVSDLVWSEDEAPWYQCGDGR